MSTTPIIVSSLPMESTHIPFYSLGKEQFKRCSVTSSLYSAEESEEESVITEDGKGDCDSIIYSTRTTSEESTLFKIRVYEPQLNLDIHSYPLSLPSTKKHSIDSPPPSRLLSAFQKIYHAPFKPTSISPLDNIKPTSTRSSSFTDRIKSKFQPKKKSQLSMTRSGSLSSMAKRWSLANRKKDTFEVKWSLSTHRLTKPSSEKAVRFAKSVSTQDTYSKTDYDRQSDPEAVCVSLTPLMAQMIKEELNAYKLHEMQVHEQSKIHTHFFI
ncbi:hypothetical protein G6F56_010169 [Rhizopus delemar]|nr:hypothetical protein G6F56_010169 [Rhizopus delemar]